MLGQIQKSPGSPHFLVGFLNFAQKLRNFFPLATLAEVHLKNFPARCARGGNGLFFAKSRKADKNPENPTQREKKKANLTPAKNKKQKKKKKKNSSVSFLALLRVTSSTEPPILVVMVDTTKKENKQTNKIVPGLPPYL